MFVVFWELLGINSPWSWLSNSLQFPESIPNEGNCSELQGIRSAEYLCEIMNACVDLRNGEEVKRWWNSMLQAGIHPNIVSFNIMYLGNLELVQRAAEI